MAGGTGAALEKSRGCAVEGPLLEPERFRFPFFFEYSPPLREIRDSFDAGQVTGCSLPDSVTGAAMP